MALNQPPFTRPNGPHFQVVSPGDRAVTLGVAFAIAIVLLGCLGGAFFFWGGGGASARANSSVTSVAPAQDAYTSVVDRTCGKNWRANQSNVDELHCYMTAKVSRLCDRDERAHLLSMINRFEKDYAAYFSRFKAEAMKSMPAAYNESLQLGIEEAQMQEALRDPNATAVERRERIETFFSRMENVMAATNKALGEKSNERKYYELEYALTALVSKAYLSEQDFEGAQPNWVNRALGAVRVVTASCKN